MPIREPKLGREVYIKRRGYGLSLANPLTRHRSQLPSSRLSASLPGIVARVPMPSRPLQDGRAHDRLAGQLPAHRRLTVRYAR